MKKILIVLIIFAGLASIIWFGKFSQYKLLNNTLVVLTSADFPPISFRDNIDNIVGFDIDVIKEVSSRLGMVADLKDRPFSMLLSEIQSGKFHVIAAGMTPTEDRAKKVNFTKPYLTGNPLIVMSLSENSPINSLEDLKGKDVIVNSGYTADIYMSKISGINLIKESKVIDAFNALEDKKGYAFVTSNYTIKPYLEKFGKNKDDYNIFRIFETDENIALGVSKHLSKDFFEKIQKVLDEMESDGTLYALKQKWEIV